MSYRIKITLPHPVIMLFGIMVMAAIASYIVPAGLFDRAEVGGKMQVVAGTYHSVDQQPVGIGEFLLSFSQGFGVAIDVVFIILMSGIMFGMLKATGSLERMVSSLITGFGSKKPELLIGLSTLLFGLLGIFVGYENNIAMVPVACMLVVALGGDLVLAAGIAVGGMTVGFGMSPFNAYTVGTAHNLAGLPMFSGAALRSIACGIGLILMSWYNIRYFNKVKNDPTLSLGIGLDSASFSTMEGQLLQKRDILILSLFLVMLGVMMYGVFYHHWFLKELSALFCGFTILIAFFTKKRSSELGAIVLNSVAEVAPGAMLVALAATIKVILEKGMISDTIAYALASVLDGLPPQLSAVGMVVTQTLMNFIIPSGSGQALATLPILFPVGDLLGLTRQTVTLAFQYGDGLSNLINPALGGMVAMIGMCKVPFDRWLKFIWPFFLMLFGVGLIVVFISVLINYGPL